MTQESNNLTQQLPTVVEPTEIKQVVINSLNNESTSLLKKNKLFIYIGIAVLVLGIILYYFYKKNKKEIKVSVVSQPKHILQDSKPGDHYIIDANGRPIKIEKLSNAEYNNEFNLNNNLGSIGLVKQINSQNQQILKRPTILPKQKIIHPNSQNSEISENNINLEDKISNETTSENIHNESNEDANISESDNDMVDEISRIQTNEDSNIVQHNLTNSELSEIHRKLEMMNQMNQ